MTDITEGQERRVTRTERELERMGEGMQNVGEDKPKAAAKSPPKKAAPKEKVGVGRDDSEANKRRLIGELQTRVAAARAAGNMDLVNKYKARITALNAL